MGTRKTPFTKKEHKEFGEALEDCVDILSPYLEKLWKGYGVKHKSASKLRKVLVILSSEICNEMDKEWYKVLEPMDGHDGNPYYAANKKFWI